MRTAVLIAALPILLAAPLLAQPNTACGNGDFESGLDPRQWSGGHGFVLRNGAPHFASFKAGLFPGLLSASSSHQTRVGMEPDPTVGISTLAPGSMHAVRIGNSVCDAHADMLAKTFVVGAEQSVIRFSYAVVLEHGAGHGPTQESSFWVRVLDASGVPIPGVVHLFGVGDKLIAGDSSSLAQKPGTDVFYRDWTRASIDLSSYAGQTVTVQLITEDCALGGHFAYAYVDDFCQSGCGGTLDAVRLPPVDCGTGDVCVHYTLPEVAGVTGSAVIRLDLLQSGATVTSMSAVVTEGSRHCFMIGSEVLSALQKGGFDFRVTATFRSGDAICEIRSAGSSTEGILPGRDNDHYVDCPSSGCGPGFNLIVNGDFEAGNSGFSSEYAYAPVSARFLPGNYSVLGAGDIAAVTCSQSNFQCAEGRFLVVNGDTGESRSRRVWLQTVPVIGGRDYRFCARFHNLRRDSFDVQPKVELRFSTSDERTSAIIEMTPDSCDWQSVARSIHIPDDVTTLTCEIWLDESGPGDGNDLAVDDIGLFRQ